MAQADYVISPNPTGLAMRTEVNQIFQAILTNNSGSVAPPTTQAGMLWGDMSNASTYYLKIRNHTNDGWVSLYAYDVATKTISPINTPAGNIRSTTVQAAINELDTEKAIDTAVVHLAGNETITGTKTFSNQLISSVTTGTAPFSIASTTKVTNLNADLLKGNDWASPASIGSTTPNAVSSTNLSYTGTLTGGTGAVNIGSGQITKDTSGNMGFSGNIAVTSTGYVKLSTGTSGQRPASALAGMIRFNTDLTSFEGYNGSGWTSVGGGATGGGTDKIFVENGQTVTTNYTITANCNASSAGDITINDGVVVTIPTGSRWVIV